jgi:hypothetical protein
LKTAVERGGGNADVSSRVARVAWYWFRTNLARRWTSYLSIVLLVGLVGGLGIGSLIAARRTESSFDVFLASTNPSDMSVFLFAPNLTTELSRLPLVRHVATASYGVSAFPAGRGGAPLIPPAFTSGDVTGIGSLGEEFFSQDKAAVVAGRMANPKRADEFVTSKDAERLMGWRVGQSIPMYFYTSAQTSLPAFGTAKVKPHLRLTMHLVGTVILNNEVISDEADRYPALMIFTPALTRPFAESGVTYNDYALKLDHGAQDVSAVEREIIAALPRNTTYTFHVTSIVTDQVDHSITPEALALGVFGLIAALAVIIIAGGLIARFIRSNDGDMRIVRALGGDRSMTASASILGLLGAIIIGASLAVGVALELSPLSPIGPVRAVYPARGIAFDWRVLGLGFAFIVVGLGLISVVLALRLTRHWADRQRQSTVPLGSKVARLFAEVGLPVSALVGARFALEPGRDHDSVPVRSALLGSVLAVMLVVATLTFGSGLNTLVTHPALFGWNWNYALASGGDVPPQSTSLLNHDPYVAAWAGVGIPNVEINGVTVPVLAAANHAAVSPPLLSGHEVDADNQIVLGAETMQQLHEHLGGVVVVTYGTRKDAPVYVPPTRLTIVGTATLPAAGGSFSLHTSMGIGAIIAKGVEPATMRKFIASPYPTLNGPNLVFVRFRAGVSSSRALASLKKIAEVGDRAFLAVPNGAGAGDSLLVLPVQYPAEIENYRSIGGTPTILAFALAAGAVVALGLTLIASVRRRRRDLALLRTLGFTKGQLMSTVAWQASIFGFVGVVVGVPLGIVFGRWVWNLFARSIYAVPAPSVPVVSVAIIVVSALVLANLVAALPGLSAARTSTARVLRGE